MAIKTEDVWKIADAVREFGSHMKPEQLETALAVLEDHKIELFRRPPGEDRRNGATKPCQDFWHAFAHRDENGKRIFALCGANQSSKTIGAAVAFCEHIRDKANNGDVYWVIAQSYQTLRDIPFKSIYQFLPKSMFPDKHKEYNPSIHEIPAMVMTLPDNRGTCEIWFRSEDQGLLKFESARLNGIWWTECASEQLYDALLPRLLARGGWMIMDFVPFYGWHRVSIRERAAFPESPLWYRKFVVMDNAHNLPDKAIERMKATMSDRMWEIRGLGKEAAAQGSVFQNFDPEVHVVAPFEIPDWWPLYMSADWGFSAPHCFALATVAPNNHLYVIAEHYEKQMSVRDTVIAVWLMIHQFRPLKLYPGCQNVNEMFDRMLQIDYKREKVTDSDYVRYIEDMTENPIRDHITAEFERVLVRPCNIDNQVFQRSGTSKTLAEEFWQCGFPISAAGKGRGSVNAGVEEIRRMLDARKFALFNTCHSIRKDMVSWSYRSGPDMSPLDKDVFSHEYSHGADSIRYMLEMSPTHSHAEESLYDGNQSVQLEGQVDPTLGGHEANRSGGRLFQR